MKSIRTISFKRGVICYNFNRLLAKKIIKLKKQGYNSYGISSDLGIRNDIVNKVLKANKDVLERS